MLDKTIKGSDLDNLFTEVSHSEKLGLINPEQLRLFPLNVMNNRFVSDNLRSFIRKNVGRYVFFRAKLEQSRTSGDLESIGLESMTIMANDRDPWAEKYRQRIRRNPAICPFGTNLSSAFSPVTQFKFLISFGQRAISRSNDYSESLTQAARFCGNISLNTILPLVSRDYDGTPKQNIVYCCSIAQAVSLARSYADSINISVSGQDVWSLFLVSMNKKVKEEKFIELPKEKVPAQKRSIRSSLANAKKKSVVEALLEGKIEFDKHPKNQTEGSYTLTRKIENVILFSISDHFLRFSNEYKRSHNVDTFQNDWYDYIEYGTTDPLTTLLQRSGFSRETSTYIRQHREEYVIMTESGEAKPRRSLLQSRNTGTARGSADIQYNMPEIFVDQGGNYGKRQKYQSFFDGWRCEWTYEMYPC